MSFQQSVVAGALVRLLSGLAVPVGQVPGQVDADGNSGLSEKLVSSALGSEHHLSEDECHSCGAVMRFALLCDSIPSHHRPRRRPSCLLNKQSSILSRMPSSRCNIVCESGQCQPPNCGLMTKSALLDIQRGTKSPAGIMHRLPAKWLDGACSVCVWHGRCSFPRVHIRSLVTNGVTVCS